MANEQLKPFTADDPRINRNGRPRDYEALRKLVRAVGYEEVDVHEDGTAMTLIESIVRDWMTSKSFRKQLAAIQYGFGKVPEKLEVERNASKIVIRWTEVDEDPEYIEDEGDAPLLEAAGFTSQRDAERQNPALGGELVPEQNWDDKAAPTSVIDTED